MDIIENPHKGCLYEDHRNKFISLICIDQNCQAKSRTGCQQCVLKKIHDNCQKFLLFDNSDRENPNFEVEYTENHKLYELCNKMYTNENNVITQINKKYDDLLQEVTVQINKSRKDTIVKYQDNMKYVKEQFKDFLDKQKEFYDFQELNKVMNRFREMQIGIEELNKSIVEKQKQYQFSEEQEVELQRQLKELKLKNLFIDTDINKCQQIKSIMIKEIEKIDRCQEKYLQIKELKAFEGLESACEFLGDSIYVGNGYQNSRPIYMSSQVFRKADKISFRFKILSLINCQQFRLGIASKQGANQQKCFWFNKGNQISLSKGLESKDVFINNGNKSLFDVFREGQIFTMEVCVQENKIIIKDEKLECIVENQKQLEQDIEEQVVVLGSNQNQDQYSIQIL